MTAQGAYGERMGERFRLRGTPALTSTKVQTLSLAVTRLRTEAVGHGMTQPIPREDAHIVALQLRDLTAHELWVEGRPVSVPAYRSGTISAVHLDQRPSAHLGRPFDCIQFYIPGSSLDRVADENGVARPGGYRWKPGVSYDDPVIRHLGLAMLPALERPAEASPLFVEQVGAAFLAHVAHAYGGMRLEPVHGGLAPGQLRQATEMLNVLEDGTVRLAALASACGLSPSHFARAFKRSTGLPPHRWLLRYRIDRAKDLLRRSNARLAEVAGACGFADQSHLTRVFRSFTGTSPGAWRRAARM